MINKYCKYSLHIANIKTYLSHYIAYKMPFKQFQCVKANRKNIVGGVTAARAVGPEELEIWHKALALPDTNAQLAAKGAPTSVVSQVVSGINYTFTFADGSKVSVYYQSWTNTLRVKVQSKG